MWPRDWSSDVCSSDLGVYKPGNVKLTPEILKNSQAYVSEKFGVGENHIDFVFHGGSGSSLEEIREAISYGVIKMNIDTDLQFAFTEGIRDYMNEYAEYLKTQIGNRKGTIFLIRSITIPENGFVKA